MGPKWQMLLKVLNALPDLRVIKEASTRNGIG